MYISTHDKCQVSNFQQITAMVLFIYIYIYIYTMFQDESDESDGWASFESNEWTSDEDDDNFFRDAEDGDRGGEEKTEDNNENAAHNNCKITEENQTPFAYFSGKLQILCRCR